MLIIANSAIRQLAATTQWSCQLAPPGKWWICCFWSYTSKHKTLIQCWFNVESTLVQRLVFTGISLILVLSSTEFKTYVYKRWADVSSDWECGGDVIGAWYPLFNHYSAEIILYKSWRPKGLFKFEIIINVLVSSFCFIWIPMLLVYGHYTYFNSLSMGIVFIHQNLTSTDVRLWRFYQFWRHDGRVNEMKWMGFQATFVHMYDLNWASRTSWGWWYDTALQTQTSYWIFTSERGINTFCFFETWKPEFERAISDFPIRQL